MNIIESFYPSDQSKWSFLLLKLKEDGLVAPILELAFFHRIPLCSLIRIVVQFQKLGPLLPCHDLDFSSYCRVKWVLRAHIKPHRICWPIYLKIRPYIIVQVAIGQKRTAVLQYRYPWHHYPFGKRTRKWIYSVKPLEFFFHQQICSGFTQISLGEIGLNEAINIM